MNIKQYHLSSKNKWNTFLSESNQQTFLFHRDFMDYHSDRFKDHSLMVYNEESLVALLPLNKVGDTVYSHQGLTYGGLIHKSVLKTEDYILIFKAVLKFLSEQGVKSITIKELPSIFLENQTNNPLNYLCFKLNASLDRMDMHSTLDMRFKHYSRSRKNGYKRGEKNELVVKEVEGFTEFWNTVLIPNLDIKHEVKPVHSLEEITLLKSRFPNQIRQFNVYHKEELVAGTTIFETNNVAHSQYISGNADKNTLGSLDFLHQYLLDEVFIGKPYFNFGISNTNEGQQINQGLKYWKEGFGARSMSQGFYTIKTENYALLNDVFV
ncbi:MAG: GNAT family N-acetyltransferase [Winogradskyella sp.]|uniref:GNAT family N-acetyltransferase n=1 Tax=Winogradskyella sp. TaxID=1883156 RepID=UPI0025DC1B9D|nr:GNAT family N-acetyltransferase [Winogradskyella sp.]NRB61256.1 GNAT family N-acetyltransferase [Winogradskyella sp.]